MDVIGNIYNEDYNKTISNFKSIYYKNKIKESLLNVDIC